jgi:hypothetical protein
MLSPAPGLVRFWEAHVRYTIREIADRACRASPQHKPFIQAALDAHLNHANTELLDALARSFMFAPPDEQTKAEFLNKAAVAQEAAARKTRKEDALPREEAIKEAIKAEAGHDALIECKQPYKLADSILDGVNQRLKGADHEPLKKNALGRRISLLKNETKV